jgi:linoleoyl-CoA desaturase
MAIERARTQVQVSSGLLLAGCVLLYCTALANDHTLLGAAALLLLPFALIGLAMHAGHNAVHGAFAHGRRANDIGLYAIDWTGVNGRLWQLRHLEHHKYPNHPQFDPDLDGGGVLDLGPSRPNRWRGLAQACYCLVAYALVVFKLHVNDDVRFIVGGRIGSRELSGRERAGLALRSVIGKTVFVGWALVLPLAILPTGLALAAFAYNYAAMGLILSLIFQVAHCNTRVEHETPLPARGGDFFRIQTCATANFRVRSKLVSWYLAGLNLQIEHHLHPSVPHPLLRNKREAIRRACDGKQGRYIEYASYLHAFRDHLKFLYEGAPHAAR